MIAARSIVLLAWAISVQAAPSAATLEQKIEVLFSEIASDVREAPLIRATDLAKLLNASPRPLDLIVLDERDADERGISGIAGAIAPGDLPAAIAKAKQTVGNVPIRIVVYCTIGYRSGKRVIALNQADAQLRAVNLRGGILSWLAQGGALVTPTGQPAKAVHVYAKRWAVVPPGFKAQY